MTGAMTAICNCGAALWRQFAIWLMGGAERRAERKASGDSFGSAGGQLMSAAPDSWTASSWFGGFHNSGGSFDSGGGDSGGGGGGGGD